MFTRIGCFAGQHDLRLVMLAGTICLLAAFTAIRLLRYAGAAVGPCRRGWLVVAAVSSGSGIFATHFIAMLAFEPSIPSGYDVNLTILSLLFAIGLTGAGLRIALAGTAEAPWVGGLAGGLGIAAMHYTGMAAFEVTGNLSWNPAIVFGSIVAGIVLTAVALAIAVRFHSTASHLGSAAILTLAICAHHFIGMAAVTITESPQASLSPNAMRSEALAGAVALVSITVLVLTALAYGLSRREQRRALCELARMHGLANAAVEGLIVIADRRIVTANVSFGRLAGVRIENLPGMLLTQFLTEPGSYARLLSAMEQPVELSLCSANSEAIEIEAILRQIDYAGRPHHALAVRDIRERKRAERRIHYLAHHDALTGLLNRGAFNAKLDRAVTVAVETAVPIAVLYLDLDRFKAVNDLFGHAAGDAMLERVAGCVTAVLGADQAMARLGGDEFAILMVGRIDAAAAERLATNILAAVESQTSGTSAGAIVGVSIGIALCPKDAVEGQILMGHADTALYRAKADGGGTYRIFEPEMGHRHPRAPRHGTRSRIRPGARANSTSSTSGRSRPRAAS